jgi:hypothetical protein
MLKKIVMFSLVITMLLSVFDCALADEPDYSATPSASEVYYGEKVSLDITTPSEVVKVKVYIDGNYKCKAALVSADGQNKWTAEVTLKKLGDRKISFRAYSSSGKLLKRFPDAPLTVTVKHILPVTESPIILDGDRAVLLGTLPQNCGVRQREYGFYFGTDSASLSTKIKSNSVIRTKMNKLVTELSPETTYYYQAYVVTTKGTFTGDIVSFVTPAQKELTAEEIAAITDITDKYEYLFGADTRYYKWKSRPYGYATKSEADKHMVKIQVPVWKLTRGKKVESTMSLTINYKLESSVVAIFQEIYNLDIKFPFYSLRGYWYRRASGPGITGKGVMSHHSFGAAIDINKKYNLFYRYRDKRNKKSPYYIPQAVIEIFEKYGWSWGGNFKEGFDTMHFQYLGLDLLG